MRFGYWTPVYGGFLRNVGDEGMPATWDYIRTISTQADRLGFELTLVPELYLNDRKGVNEPSLEAWSLATAIAAVTEKLEILTAIRPGYHNPQVTAKRLSTLADVSNDRFSLNVVAAWWEEEAKQFGGVFPSHDDRYVHCTEFVDALRGLWTQNPYSQHGRYFSFEDTVVEPKPAKTPKIYAGGESEGGREAIAGFADSYVTHGGTVEELREKAADVNARRFRLQGAPFETIGMSAYVIVRDTEAEARAELERITTVDPNSPGYASFEEFVAHSKLDVEVSKREYSVGTRALRPELVGTPEQVAEKIAAYRAAGVNLLLIQASPLHEELERIASDLIPLVREIEAGAESQTSVGAGTKPAGAEADRAATRV
ncbi:LLM class flavin-dependent oxidoreductase [Brevibacterium sp. CS2]|uniref:LLM class flavin-dependent oxidoreductase n=1 Tax=Brevibacterium sp. CS2 TaxID=2575923 RepID=UPI0010C7BC6C|nr:LLM class flavin-dependent oxidoreductase [Brevibacterium sp. CS2]QCP04797.1 LLM class flavin-dependent oxidoreductase [Brevibacterium sp. CS2]